MLALFFMGMGTVAGAYLILSEAIPRIFALNDTAKVWSLSASTAGQYATSLVAVDDTGAHPSGGATGANEFANPDFATNTDSWSVAAAPPSGWVEVPGNGTYSTSNFLAMKYEAKCAATGTPAIGLTTPEVSSYNTYDDNASACTTANGKRVVSVASGYPIANVTQTSAITRCSTVSVGTTSAHLQTNDEWMTIARDAEAQDANWTLGSVGSGYLFAGHNDNAPAKARIASSTDTGNNACAYTDSAGTSESPSGCPSNTASGSSGTAGNQKRVLTLSNGAPIWDIAGNVWEWTNDTIQGKNQPTGATPGFGWREFTALTTYGTLSYDKTRPAHSSYASATGVGQIYSDGTASNTTAYAFCRGGGWGGTSNAGVFALSLFNTPGSQYNSVGFRCASDPVAISSSFSSSSGRFAAGGTIFSVGPVSDGKLFQRVNVGDTATYDFSVFVSDATVGHVGGTVDATVASLEVGGTPIATTYTDQGSGWWKLSATVTGTASLREYGIIALTGKSLHADDFSLVRQGTFFTYPSVAYSNILVNTWDTFCEGSLAGSVCTEDATHVRDASISYQFCDDDGSACESGNTWKYWDGSVWQTAGDTSLTHANTPAQLTRTAMQSFPTGSKKISFRAIFRNGDSADVPRIPHVSIGLTTDTERPVMNASGIVMRRSTSGTTVGVAPDDRTNSAEPYFSWTPGADDPSGSGVRGYCLYLGTDPSGDPATSKGLLGASPASIAGTDCQFIVSSTSIDFASAVLRGSPWLVSSTSSYYFSVKVVDNSGNTFGGDSASFPFRYDGSAPTNVSYISCASGSFSNVVDMSFSWPTDGSAAATDGHAGIFGWQYQINATTGTWRGTTTESVLGIGDYFPLADVSYALTDAQDSGSIVSGNNIVYFRSVDAAGNPSSDSTIRTCNLAFGGIAPAFGSMDTVTIAPSTSTSNEYALSWPEATASSGRAVSHYYYMINTQPPATFATLRGNASTYIDNGTSTSVPASALPNVNKGVNTVVVVAVDDADTPNYSPSNKIEGSFTLDSTDPDNVTNIVASDSSIKSLSQWNVTLTWGAPAYQGAGNLSYLVYRSTDGISFSSVGSTAGLSYVDTTPESREYYYKVYVQDGADARSSGSNAVTLVPTGKWTTPPTLDKGPDVNDITTGKATISWGTSRSADSKIAYGTKRGKYGEDEISNSDQTGSHSVNLTNLDAGTSYYYRAKWTDEDGNTGESEEQSFQTADAPTVKDVSVRNIGLDSALVRFTSKGASEVKIFYGPTTGFGGSKTISTSSSETTYTAELPGLQDGTKYYYKINTFDADGKEYEGTVLDFATLPRPKISNVRIQQVANTAQSTILVTWITNTEISSIVSYAPEGKPDASRDEVSVALTTGEHKMIIRGLLPQTGYVLTVRGRDKAGNEAVSDSQRLTTATDTRPPQMSGISIKTAIVPSVTSSSQESMAQAVVSWNTDEPATSQVEFGEGTGTAYAQKTQEDGNLTTNHLVIVSGLSPSKVYHLRTISADAAGNIGHSIDTVTITPKTIDNALDLVISNLREAFRFLGSFGGGR
ncbi:MAG: hypothetical protein HGB37_02935 [Candidatus Moranbacteria bacterium]|nr:hypothetical protein [Candidatus Moranbacteria bacterium]